MNMGRGGDYNTVGVNQLGQGFGARVGGDGLGDEGYGGGNGVVGKGCNYGNKRSEVRFVNSSNIDIATFSGSSFSIQPYLSFYKSIRRRIYNQVDESELLLVS